MIDSAVETLEKRGVARAHIHFDRFTTQYEAAQSIPASVTDRSEASSTDNPPAGPLDYLKYALFHGVGLVALAAILAGGAFVTAGLVSILLLYMLGDAIAGDDTSTPRFTYPGILTAQLWMALPLLALIVFAAVWSVCPGDPLGFGAALTAWTGYDVLAARNATTFGHHVSTWIITGLMIGMVGTITAHELTHRTWDPISMFIGRWLLAFSFDTTFAIEHVYCLLYTSPSPRDS
ncbi:MAG: flavodoxin reductase, partial [Candidatus Eisenbacteria bacterium]|nr:flavodoxin reductase [Candidatus Eisenbacteria bacterium]